jgi:hypothetical protein
LSLNYISDPLTLWQKARNRTFLQYTVYTGNYYVQPEPQGAVGGAAAAPPPHPPPRPPPPEAKKRKKEKAALLPVLAFTPTNKVIKMDHYNINKPAAKQQQQAEAKQAVEQAAADSKAGQATQQPKHIPGGTCMPLSYRYSCCGLPKCRIGTLLRIHGTWLLKTHSLSWQEVLRIRDLVPF